MADSFSKKEREKKKRKKKQEKAERRTQKKLNDDVRPDEIVYVDAHGNFTSEPPDESDKEEIDPEDIWVSTPKDSELEEIDSQKKGVVKFFNEEKRFGFIKESLTGEDFFVHEENLIDPIRERDHVEFEIGHGPKGLVAINVKLSS